MRAWRVTGSPDMTGFTLVDAPASRAGPGEVEVRLKAASLNYRDTMVAAGTYPLPVSPDVIPLCDGSWEVIAVGSGATRFKPGDRVINIYAQGWIEGPLESWMWATGYGTVPDGTLTQRRVFPEEVLVGVPDGIGDAEAATLPCAAVTAWNALFGHPPALQPGQTVLTIGTGGVSVFALQLAKAAGARVVTVSGSDEKLDRARSLGADTTINRREHPDWEHAVRAAIGGEGVDLVIEVGGPGTLARSLAALRHGGRIAMIGALADPMATVHPGLILLAHATVHGVMVGNRRHTQALVAAVAANGIRPAVDRIYPFEEAPQAFRDMTAGRHFGKLVIAG